MNFVNMLFHGLVYGVALTVLMSCTNPKKQLESMLDKYPAAYKLSDFKQIGRHYVPFVKNKSQYIVFKEFSQTGYTLVSLINTDEQYILSISLPAIPNGTLSKEIDKDAGRLIFNNIKDVISLDYFSGKDSFHPRCIISGIRTENTNSVNGVYNPSMHRQEKTVHTNNSLRIYLELTALVYAYLPDARHKIFSAYKDKLTPIKIGDKEFTENNYIDASEGERNAFKQKLLTDPFFEIKF